MRFFVSRFLFFNDLGMLLSLRDEMLGDFENERLLTENLFAFDLFIEEIAFRE